MKTIGDVEFYTDDAAQADRCAKAQATRKVITESYDTYAGERTVTGRVIDVREEILPNQSRRWRIAIRP